MPLREKDGRILPGDEVPFWPAELVAARARQSLVIPNYLGYDLDAPRRRLLVLEEPAPVETPAPAGLRLVLGWLDEVSARLSPSP